MTEKRIRKRIIAYNITVPAGGDIKQTVYTVKSDKMKLTRWVFVSEAGALGYVWASLYYGDMKIAPEEGELSTDKFVLDVWLDTTFYRGDKVVMRLRNTSANNLPVYGFLEFVEEMEGGAE